MVKGVGLDSVAFGSIIKKTNNSELKIPEKERIQEMTMGMVIKEL